MDLRIVSVDQSNRKEIESLTVARGQEGFVETVKDCLKEAGQVSCWRPVGIYDGNLLIGFAMYCRWDDNPKERVWLDRFLIAAEYQGRGYGKASLGLLIKHLQETYGCHRIYLSVTPGNSHAESLYRQFGFRKNGELDINGEHVMVMDDI